MLIVYTCVGMHGMRRKKEEKYERERGRKVAGGKEGRRGRRRKEGEEQGGRGSKREEGRREGE